MEQTERKGTSMSSINDLILFIEEISPGTTTTASQEIQQNPTSSYHWNKIAEKFHRSNIIYY
jgi:hypothetical protein